MTRLLVLLALATPLNAALLGQIAVMRGSRTSQITAVQRTQTEINVASPARDLRKHLQAKTATSPSSASALAATFAAAAAAAADSAAAPFSEAADPSDSTATAAAATVTPTQLVESFVAATERGDAAAALALVTDDFLYKTHSATTESRAAAEKRLHTKCPAPAKVTSAPSPSTHPQAKP